ncbi:MAG: AraC family transcriptional regulator [Niabella sp.]|nr:AraC family transcriptional regulator [Niabella sp.]
MLQKKEEHIKKKDGFNGQMAIVLPNPIIKRCASEELLRNLYITDIGFYPRAQYHHRKREQGSQQHILIYCVDGCGWANIDGRKVEVREGEYLVIPSHSKHEYGADTLHPWSIYWVHFKGNDADRFVGLLKKEKDDFVGAAAFSEKRTTLFTDIYSTLESGYSMEHLYYINMVFMSYLGTFCFPQFLDPPHKKEQNQIDGAIIYMQQHIDTVVSLKELAAFAHMSSSHFSALFKKKTGYPPLDYFNHLKIQKACQYLEFTDISVKELCYKLGLNDPFYFSRLFSRYMGESPVRYRKRKKFA